jgi:signal transduction histidine kinase
MKERVSSIGWDLEIESQPGKGTRIIVSKNEDGKGNTHVQT